MKTQLINNKPFFSPSRLRVAIFSSGAALIVFLLLHAVTLDAAVHNLGVFGTTYSIAEKDAIEEIREKASTIDWKKYFNKEQMEQAVKNYRPKEPVSLPVTTGDKKHNVDLTYTLDFDIPDGKGGILYPKGYSFNPLDYLQLPNILVVIDASDDRQVQWFLSSEYANDYRTMLLITEGKFWDVSHALNKPVFYVTRQIADRFQLSAVPSVIKQAGQYMEVRQIALKQDKNMDNNALPGPAGSGRSGL